MVEIYAVFKIAFIFIQLNDFYLVLSVLNKWAESKSEVLFRSIAKIYCKEGPLRFMSIYLLFLGLPTWGILNIFIPTCYKLQRIRLLYKLFSAAFMPFIVGRNRDLTFTIKRFDKLKFILLSLLTSWIRIKLTILIGRTLSRDIPHWIVNWRHFSDCFLDLVLIELPQWCQSV